MAGKGEVWFGRRARERITANLASGHSTRMPPGVAELWPLHLGSETVDLSTARTVPAQIALEAGENVATIVLRKRQ